MKKLRIYVDTSVIGGCHDTEFAEASEKLLAMARDGKVTLVISDLMIAELRRAPVAVQQVLDTLPESAIEAAQASEESAPCAALI